jgi:hypothetical protein
MRKTRGTPTARKGNKSTHIIKREKKLRPSRSGIVQAKSFFFNCFFHLLASFCCERPLIQYIPLPNIMHSRRRVGFAGDDAGLRTMRLVYMY